MLTGEYNFEERVKITNAFLRSIVENDTPVQRLVHGALGPDARGSPNPFLNLFAGIGNHLRTSAPKLQAIRENILSPLSLYLQRKTGISLALEDLTSLDHSGSCAMASSTVRMDAYVCIRDIGEGSAEWFSLDQLRRNFRLKEIPSPPHGTTLFEEFITDAGWERGPKRIETTAEIFLERMKKYLSPNLWPEHQSADMLAVRADLRGLERIFYQLGKTKLSEHMQSFLTTTEQELRPQVIDRRSKSGLRLVK